MARTRRHPGKRLIVVIGALSLIAIVTVATVLSLRNGSATTTTTTTSLPSMPKRPTHAGARWQPPAPASEGGLKVVGSDETVDIAEIDDALVEACATFATNFSLFTPSRTMCSKRTPEGRAEALAQCRDHILQDDAPILETAIEDGRVKANLAGLRACAAAFKNCDERFALVGQVGDGGACDDTIECAPPLTCAAPDPSRQEFKCTPLGAPGDACEDFILPCAKGIACLAGTCTAPHFAAPGERCGRTAGGAGVAVGGGGDEVVCAPGFVCGGTGRCRPEGKDGERCEQSAGMFSSRGDGSCGPNLLCVDGVCRAPIESGGACTPGKTTCADDCDVCRPVVDGEPPMCAPRGYESDRCEHDDDCLAGLACAPASRPGIDVVASLPASTSSSTSTSTSTSTSAQAPAPPPRSCVPAPPPPVDGEACARPEGCDGDDCLTCADGFHCAHGRCAGGKPGAACDDVGDCDNGMCVKDVCVALPSSGPCLENTCAEHFQCVDGACAAERTFGALCDAGADPARAGAAGADAAKAGAAYAAGPRCAGDLVCLDGRCLPRRWGGERCREDGECQSLACMKHDDGDGVCRASRP